MGRLVMHEWGRLLALTSGTYTAWATLWAFAYRKFFWDFVGGELGPTGLIPPPSAALFVTLIVDVPIIQVFNLLNGMLTLALEWPAPFLVNSPVRRAFIVRVVFYIWCGFLALLPYQSVDASVFYLISAAVFARALSLGEVLAEDVVSSSRHDA